MFKFDIQSRLTGEVLFTAGLDCDYGNVTKNRRAAVMWALKRGQPLAGANLSFADLAGLDFTGKILKGANLAHADLRGADFGGANLCNVIIDSANFDGANFDGALLVGTELSNVDLTNVDLSRADLDGTKLKGAYLVAADFEPPTKADGTTVEPKKDPAHDGLSRLAWIEELYDRIIDQLDALLTECKQEKNNG